MTRRASGQSLESSEMRAVGPQYNDMEKPAAGDRQAGNKRAWEGRDSAHPPPTVVQFEETARGESPPKGRNSARKTSISRSSVGSDGLAGHSNYVPPRRTTIIKWLVARDPKYLLISRRIVENRVFVAFAAILTIYALVGDDLRLLCTNKPADFWFNAATLVCLFVFTLEIVLSCLGKDDYILGFFMALDVVSTATLVLDLSYVSDFVLGDGEDLDKMRSGRTARVGAKAGRVVRVIRLVRILKLYKVIHEAILYRQQKNAPDDEWADIDTTRTTNFNLIGEQSRVGKKLSEMTTRRVIILVLTMLMVLPFLRTQSGDNLPPAAFYGADEVLALYREYRAMPLVEERRQRYENAVMRYLYYHNWFSGSCSSDADCPTSYYSHVFWVGIVTQNEGNLEAEVNSTRLRASTVRAFADSVAAAQDDMYNYGTMPDEVVEGLSGEWRSDCNEHSKSIYRSGVSLLQQEIEGEVGYAVPCPQDLRNVEKTTFYPRKMRREEYDLWRFTFYFDTRPFSRSEAMFGLITTGFICVVLCVSALYFSNDANQLVLRPVEKMIKRVEAIRDNPLAAMKMADEEFKMEERERHRLRLLKERHRRFHLQARAKALCKCGPSTDGEPMETVVLEKTIIKLGSLLALGFGEAGAHIIGHNMEESDSAGVNVMIPGVKVECIVGKAGIHNFSTATEVLQAKVMTFVNQIAEIVHGVVDEFHGAANKNNGDTFLVIWRTSGLDEHQRAKCADMSMVAFARIFGGIHRSAVLVAYRGHPGLQQRLGTNCRVSLSFGLHAGWAIEGAVGSEFKIDASYLSPNVSIASSVAGATMMYGVPIIASQSVVQLCNSEMAAKCRLIDRVVITGSADPVDIYSLDLDHERLEVEPPRDPKWVWNLRQRFKARQYLEAEKLRKLTPEVKMVNEFDHCRDIVLMRRTYSTEFLQLFHMGYQNYAHGEWRVAKHLLEKARGMLSVEDGPCKELLRFMEYLSFEAPDGWQGVRDLPVSVSLDY